MKIRILLLLPLMLAGCRQQTDQWVVRVKKFSVSENSFQDKFKNSVAYRDSRSFTATQLKAFAEKSLLDDLLFMAEGYAMGIDREEKVIEAVEQRKLRILKARDGPLFNRVVHATDSKEIEQQVKAYIGELVKKYHFEIDPQGAAQFIVLSQTPRAKVRDILFDSTYTPDPNKITLVSYTGLSLTVAEVIRGHSRDFILNKNKIKKARDVEYYVLEWFLPELLKKEAEALGLNDDPAVQQQFLQAERNIVRGECKKRLTARNIKVSSQEVDERYALEGEKWQGVSETRAKRDIRKRIRMEKKIQRTKEILADLRAKYTAEYNQAALKRIAKKLSKEKVR